MSAPPVKRKAEACRASKRSVRPKPAAAPPSNPPSAAGAASMLAAAVWAAAPPSLRDRCDQTAPPPKLEVPAAGTVRPSPTVHTRETTRLDLKSRLRSSRKVVVPNTAKLGPMQFRKGERPIPDASWQTPTCAKVGLEHYNQLNEEDEYELVKPIDSIVFFFNGPWMHANFLAKPKGATGRVKCFFAELKIGPEGKEKMACVSCTKLDPVDPQTAPVRGCKTCPSRILHPAAGGYQGGSVQVQLPCASSFHRMTNAVPCSSVM